MSNWEHNKQHALKLLHRLLGVWQGQPNHLLDNITTIGIQANIAVNALQLQTGLPLPYDDEKMPDDRLTLHQPRPINGTEDEISKNIRAWINLLGEAVPNQDLSGMITQEKASFEYDIPEPTLFKYAKKKPGEFNFLWSIKQGRHRYYRKKDIRALKQSRNKL